MRTSIVEKIDVKIRKLQQLRELASDPEMLSMLSSLVEGRTNGTAMSSIGGYSAKARSKLKKTLDTATTPKGVLKAGVVNAIQKAPDTFSGYSLTDQMIKEGFPFTAANPATAVNDVLRVMLKKGHHIKIAKRGRGSSPTFFRKLSDSRASA
jgi:hypothetical protein